MTDVRYCPSCGAEVVDDICTNEKCVRRKIQIKIAEAKRALEQSQNQKVEKTS